MSYKPGCDLRPDSFGRRKHHAPSVLVADDDPAIRKIVTRLLQQHGMTVLTCVDGSQALNSFTNEEIDLVLLDIRMPEINGLTVCKEIRASSEVPIIMLTGMLDERDAADALEAGADDYVRKPFGVDELLARVQVVLRRTSESFAPATLLTVADITVDVPQRTVCRNGTEIDLTKTEFNLLIYLLSNPDRVLTHDQILEKIWGADYVGAHHILRVCISRLRQKLGDANEFPLTALSGIGYRLRRN